MPGLLYADDLVLFGESEEDLKVMVGCFDWSVRSMCMGHNWRKCHRSNIWGVFWLNKVQMLLRGRKVAGLVNARGLFLECPAQGIAHACSVLWQIIWREKELCRWIPSEICWVFREWIVLNVRIEDLSGGTKREGVDERIIF